jgi:lysophospholipase L1-like esterase
MIWRKNALPFLAGFAAALAALSFYYIINHVPNGKLAWAPRRKRVVFFGDSITQHGFNPDISGWVAMLAHWWSRRVDVINRGFSGYNSRWAQQIVDKVLPDERPDLVFIFFGANDAVDPSVLQHVPLTEFKSNLQYIVEYIQKVRY